MNTLKFWLVFTIGVAAGAAVALVYAPATGEETRKKLKQGFDDASGYVKDTTAQIADQAQGVYNKSKSAVSGAVDTATSAVSSAVDTATSAVNSATDAAKKKAADYA